jgi:hypothetical protein
LWPFTLVALIVVALGLAWRQVYFWFKYRGM